MISSSVIQDIYDVFRSTELVEDLIKLAFPILPTKPILIFPPQPLPPTKSTFFTKKIIKKYKWMFMSKVNVDE